MPNPIEARAVTIASKMGSSEDLEALYSLLLHRRKPDYLRSENDPEFTCEPLEDSVTKGGIKPINIHPGSPWENGNHERFDGTLRREALNAEWFAAIRQAQTVINQLLKQYNHIRSHHALGMRPPVPETIFVKPQISGT
jgi:transposase InsO family protein